MRVAVVIACVALSAATAAAHKPSDSYLNLEVADTRVAGQWDIALRDLDQAVGLDSNSDGVITWGEVRGQHGTIAAYALARLQLSVDDAACASRATEHLIDTHTDGTYAVLRFVADCPAPIRSLELGYGLLFDLDPQHRGIATISTNQGARTLLFSPEHAVAQVDLEVSGVWPSLLGFWREGVWHIWTGFDHILFLLCLLMPAVLRRDSSGWLSVASFGPALMETLKVVSAFTLAHSLTLGLAAFGIFHVSSRLVESAIAASVVVVALNNAKPWFGPGRWLVGFGFGLLHGLGFASVLADPGAILGQRLVALVGFNFGVESGQLAIVGVFLPIAYAVRSSWFYQRFALLVGSSLIAAVALVWVFERLLDMRLLS